MSNTATPSIMKNFWVQLVGGLGIVVFTAITTVSFVVPANIQRFDEKMKQRELHDDRTDFDIKEIRQKLTSHDMEIRSIKEKDSLHWLQLMESLKDIKDGQKLQTEKFDKFVEGYYNRPTGN